MQAIQTRYKVPTDTKGTRINAMAMGGTVTIPYDYKLSDELNHREAAWKLIAKLGWERSDYVMESGTLPTGDMCHLYFKEA